MGWKGRRFWRSRLWVNFPLIALFSAFRKENQRLVSTSPLHLMPPILETNAKEMLNTLSFNEKEEGLGEGLWRTSYVKLFSETDSEFPQSNPCCTKREFCRAHKNQKKSHGIFRDNTKARSGCSQNVGDILHSLDNSFGSLEAVGSQPPAREKSV